MFDMLQIWIAKARKSKLSTRVTALFVAALIVPWCAFAWLTTTERSEQVVRTERTLASLAAAYAEHATTLMRLGIAVPTDEAVSKSGLSNAMQRGEQELATFLVALNAPGVNFSLHRIGEGRTTPSAAAFPTAFDDRNDRIAAEIARPTEGIAATASMRNDDALKDWRARANAEAIALLLRSLFVVGVGAFLVRQLRWREAAQTELVVAKETAESASRAKSAFLANMSHELRTPLNAILGFSEIIKRQTFGPSSERYPDYAGDIFNSGTHLLTLINDILNLSKLEAGQFVLEEASVNLSVTVEACIKLVETMARQSKVRVTISLDRTIDLIRADERRLRQILINLLSNAVKFTPEGGYVRVSSTLRKDGLAIEVSDSGIGMAAEDIPKAMTPFAQVDSKVRRKQEGTGLGLPLAKQLVELHGGTFTIESKLGAGTTVSFVLPRERIIASPSRPMALRAAG